MILCELVRDFFHQARLELDDSAGEVDSLTDGFIKLRPSVSLSPFCGWDVGDRGSEFLPDQIVVVAAVDHRFEGSDI
jgi:hypothetical protein